MDSEHQGYLIARNKVIAEKEAALAIRKRDIMIRAEYHRTKNYSWGDSAKKTPLLLSQEYNLPIEEINLIIK